MGGFQGEQALLPAITRDGKLAKKLLLKGLLKGYGGYDFESATTLN
jgi:hypothetical protein